MSRLLPLLLLAACYRSPGRLTEHEATVAVEAVTPALRALAVPHALVPPILAYHRTNGLTGLKPHLNKELLSCDDSAVVCDDGDPVRICEVTLEEACGTVDLEGAFTVVDLGDEVLFSWGVAEEAVDPMRAGDGPSVWGSTVARFDDDTLRLAHTLSWSPAGEAVPDDAAIVAQASSPDLVDDALATLGGALLGEVVGQASSTGAAAMVDLRSGILLEEGFLSIVLVQPPFEPWPTGDAPSAEACTDEGDCEAWVLRPVDLQLGASHTDPQGSATLELTTPERDEATLTWSDDVEVTAGNASYSVPMPEVD